MISSKELRKKWLDFYISKGHTDIGAVSLIGDGTTGVMFNVAGMQALMPYLLGAKHPSGSTRLCNIQGCVRTVDIESVGDASHLTFFEMMGNWSLGDYFKKEKTAWTFELLTKEFGLKADELRSTVFEGNESAPRDEETAEYLKELGIKPEHIFYLGKKDNWWELEGTTGTPCGPDNEWFYPRHNSSCGENCGPECDCGRFVEIGNDVSVGHNVTIHGATIKDGALIGMGSTILDYAVVGEGAIVAAGALVLSNTVIEPGTLWAGVPAKFIKKIPIEQSKELNQKIANGYLMYASWFKEEEGKKE